MHVQQRRVAVAIADDLCSTSQVLDHLLPSACPQAVVVSNRLGIAVVLLCRPHKEKKRKERKKDKKEKKHKHREQHKERKHKHRKHQEHAATEAADPEAAAAGAGSAAAGAVDKGFDQQEYVMRILFDDGRSQEGLPSVDIPAVFTEEHEAEELVLDEDTISLQRARAKEEEVWVLRLPDGVGIPLLQQNTATSAAGSVC